MEAGTGRPLRLAIAGTGNVATHLASAFARSAAVDVVAIVNRNPDNARRLSATLPEATAWGGFGLLHDIEHDVLLVSVADKALGDVARQIGRIGCRPLALHTSGTLQKEVLAPVSDRKGIIYPLQTFSRDSEVDVASVPFFNEADTVADLRLADYLTASISGSVHHADGDHRRILHIAGVFSSNFPNVLLECTERILAAGGYGLEVVRPLVHAMVDKAFVLGPHAAQTGPARRGDMEVIDRQLATLPADLVPVYEVLTNLILKSHGNEQN